MNQYQFKSLVKKASARNVNPTFDICKTNTLQAQTTHLKDFLDYFHFQISVILQVGDWNWITHQLLKTKITITIKQQTQTFNSTNNKPRLQTWTSNPDFKPGLIPELKKLKNYTHHLLPTRWRWSVEHRGNSVLGPPQKQPSSSFQTINLPLPNVRVLLATELLKLFTRVFGNFNDPTQTMN